MRKKPRKQSLKLLMGVALAGLLLESGVMAAEATFEDQTVQLGLKLDNSPACRVDVNNDGWTDIICGGVYWKNDAGKGFTKVQEGLGSVVAADYDNDGYVDLFSYTTHRLYHNERGKRFVEAPLPELPVEVSVGACWGDFNGDRFVDLYVGGYEDWDRDITFPSVILLNRQGKGFELASTEAKYRTRGVTACDFDRRNGLDIYLSNYRLQPNLLLMNNGKGVFRDEAAQYNVVATSPGFAGGHSIGAAWGDFDNDSWIDLFAGNFAHIDKERGDQPKSRFLRNPGAPEAPFEDKGTCGVFYQESYATPALGDYDNDGRLDLFFTTIYEVASYGKPNHAALFRQASPWEFTDATAEVDLGNLPPTYQAAWGDFNNDGQLDLLTAGKLFVNQGTGCHWLKIRLKGDGHAVNASAIGAQVRLKLGSQTLTRQVEAGTGQGNQNDLVLHFGLGDWNQPFDLEIFWPNGSTQTVNQVKADRLLSVSFQP